MFWYYYQGDEQKGPVTDEQFKELASRGIIHSSTLVWNETMSDWMRYWDVVAGTQASRWYSPPETTAAAPGAAQAAATTAAPANAGATEARTDKIPAAREFQIELEDDDDTQPNLETAHARAAQVAAQPAALPPPQPPGPGEAACVVCKQNFLLEHLVQYGADQVCRGCESKYNIEQRLRPKTQLQPRAQPRFRYAGVFIRTFACVLDSIVLFFIAVLLSIAFAVFIVVGGGSVDSGLLQVQSAKFMAEMVFLLIWALYYVLFWGSCGATPGKMMLGIKIVTTQGEKIGIGLAILRLTLLNVVVTILMVIGGVIAVPLVCFGGIADAVIGFLLALIGICIPCLIGAYLAAADPEKATLYDKWSGTRVIHR